MISSIFSLLLAVSLHANDKLNQVHQNVSNANHNLELWKDNAAVASDNLASITKALEVNRELQKKWKQNFDKVQSQISEIDKSEKQFETQKLEEERILNAEKKQIQQLEALLNDIKAQHQKRQENLASADSLKSSFLESRKTIKKTFDEQIEIRDSLVAQEKDLVKDGNDWAKKKQESSRNVTKWQKLYEYHAKLKNNYDRLSQNKD